MYYEYCIFACDRLSALFKMNGREGKSKNREWNTSKLETLSSKRVHESPENGTTMLMPLKKHNDDNVICNWSVISIVFKFHVRWNRWHGSISLRVPNDKNQSNKWNFIKWSRKLLTEIFRLKATNFGLLFAFSFDDSMLSYFIIDAVMCCWFCKRLQ